MAIEIPLQMLIPSVNVHSFKDVYELAQKSNINDQTIAFTANGLWIELADIEYAWLASTLCENVVDWPVFFVKRADAYDILARALRLDVMTQVSKLAMITLFSTFPLADCYIGRARENRDNIIKLEKIRSAAWQLFLLDPEEYPDIWSPEPFVGPVWSSKRPGADRPARVINDTQTVLKNLTEMTYGIIGGANHILGDANNQSFPYDNVVIAGGSVSKLVSANYTPRNAATSDIDLFICGETQESRSSTFLKLVAWFKSPRTYFAIIGSVVSVYIKDIPRKFQIISGQHQNPYEILDGFDLSHVCWCIWNSRVYGTVNAFNALKTRTTQMIRFHNIKQIRMLKALASGYDVVIDAITLEKCDCTRLIADWDKDYVQNMIADSMANFFPTTQAQMDEVDEMRYITANIRKHLNYDHVIVDTTDILKKVIIGGNFMTSYSPKMFSDIRLDKIDALNVDRLRQSISIGRKAIRFMSDDVIVIGLSIGPPIVIELQVSQEFAQFCNTIDTRTAAQLPNFKKNMVEAQIDTREAVAAPNTVAKVRILITPYILEGCQRYGRSIIRDQFNALDINEDLKIGDTLRISFTIQTTKIQQPHGRPIIGNEICVRDIIKM